MNTKIGFMRWLGTKRLGHWPPAQWPEEGLFWEMLLHGTIRGKPWKERGQAIEQWSQLPWWWRAWKRKQRHEMERLGKVLWYGCLFRAGRQRLSEEIRNTDGRIEIEVIKEEVLLEAQKWQAVKRGQCIRDCVDVHQKRIDGMPLDEVKNQIHTYRQLSWWRRWWHWGEGQRVNVLARLQVFLDGYTAVKQTAVEQLERVKVVYQREGRIKMNEEKKYELRGQGLIAELELCKESIQRQHQALTKKGATLSWDEFVNEHKKEWECQEPVHIQVCTFRNDLSESGLLLESEPLKRTKETLEKTSADVLNMYSQQRLAYWQCCLEEKLWAVVFEYNIFRERAEKRCLEEGKKAFEQIEQDYMKWLEELPTRIIKAVLEKAPIEVNEADEIEVQFRRWFAENERLKIQCMVDIKTWLLACSNYALKRCRDTKDLRKFEDYEAWIFEKLQAIGVIEKPSWLLNQHRLFVEQSDKIKRHDNSIVPYRGAESLEAGWDRILKSYLEPRWRCRVIEKVGTNFYLPSRKEGIEENLEWLRKQYHRLALRYHSDHGSGEAGKRCFQALQTWFTTQSEMIIKAVIPSPINIIWAQMAMGKDRSLEQIEADYQACLDQALIERAQKKIEEWEQQERQKQAEKNERELAEFNRWIRDRNEKIDLLNEDIETLKEGFKEEMRDRKARAEILNARAETMNARAETLKEDIETLKEGFKEEMRDRNARAETLKEDIETLKAGMRDRNARAETLKEDIGTLKEGIKTFNEEFKAFQLEMDRRLKEVMEAQQKELLEESGQGLARKAEQEKVVEKKPKHKEKKQGKANRNRFFSHQGKVLVAAAPTIHVMTEQQHRITAEKRQKPKTAKYHVS